MAYDICVYSARRIYDINQCLKLVLHCIYVVNPYYAIDYSEKILLVTFICKEY